MFRDGPLLSLRALNVVIWHVRGHRQLLACGDATDRVAHGGRGCGHGGAAQAGSEPVLLLFLFTLVTGLLVLLPVAGMLANRVIIAVVDDT